MPMEEMFLFSCSLIHGRWSEYVQLRTVWKAGGSLVFVTGGNVCILGNRRVLEGVSLEFLRFPQEDSTMVWDIGNQ